MSTSNLDCSICASRIGEPRDDGSVECGVTLPCAHFFGLRCLAHSIRERGSCPICRARIPNDIIIDLTRVARGLVGSATGDRDESGAARNARPWSELDAEEGRRDVATMNRERGIPDRPIAGRADVNPEEFMTDGHFDHEAYEDELRSRGGMPGRRGTYRYIPDEPAGRAGRRGGVHLSDDYDMRRPGGARLFGDDEDTSPRSSRDRPVGRYRDPYSGRERSPPRRYGGHYSPPPGPSRRRQPLYDEDEQPPRRRGPITTTVTSSGIEILEGNLADLQLGYDEVARRHQANPSRYDRALNDPNYFSRRRHLRESGGGRRPERDDGEPPSRFEDALNDPNYFHRQRHEREFGGGRRSGGY